MLIYRNSREIPLPNRAESSRTRRADLDVGLRLMPSLRSDVRYVKAIERLSIKDSDIFVETSCLGHEKEIIPYRILVRSREAVHGSYLVVKGVRNAFRRLGSPVDRIGSSFLKVALMTHPKDIEVMSVLETFTVQNLVPELHDSARLAEAARAGNVLSLMTMPIAESMLVHRYLHGTEDAFPTRVFRDMLMERDPAFNYALDHLPMTAFQETYMFNDAGWEPLVDVMNRSVLTEFAATFDVIATPHADHFHEIREVETLQNRYMTAPDMKRLEDSLDEIGAVLAALSHLLSREYGNPYARIGVEIERHWLDVVRIIVREGGQGEVLSDTYLDLALKSLTPVSLREERP